MFMLRYLISHTDRSLGFRNSLSSTVGGPTQLGIYDKNQVQAWSPVVYIASHNVGSWFYLIKNNQGDTKRPPR